MSEINFSKFFNYISSLADELGKEILTVSYLNFNNRIL
jgi:hypothetical protein